MAILTKNGNRYYYRRTRVGDKVISRYMGRADAPLAQVMQHYTALDRQRRADDRAQRAAERAEIARPFLAYEGVLDDLAALAGVMLDVAFVRAGYHKTSSREWRKRRGQTR